MGKRSFDEDVADVAAIQAGDQDAMERFLTAYESNFEFWSRGWRHHFDSDERLQICRVAALEWAMKAEPDQARRARTLLKFEVTHAFDKVMFPSLDDRLVRKMRAALLSMRPPVNADDPDPLTIEQASAKYKLPVDAIRSFANFDSPIQAAFVDDPSGGERRSLSVRGHRDLPVEPEQGSLVKAREAVTSDRLELALSQLRPREADVLRLEMEGMSREVIKDELGISDAALRNHRSVGIASLRKSLSV